MKTKEQLEQPVAAQWRAAFWSFIQTGEANPDFLTFLDKDEGTQRALDEALQIEADRVHALGHTAAPPAEAPKPSRWGWLGTRVVQRLAVAAVLSLGPCLAIAAFYWWHADSALRQVTYIDSGKGSGGQGTGVAQAQQDVRSKTILAVKDNAAALNTSNDPQVWLAAVNHLDSFGSDAKWADSADWSVVDVLKAKKAATMDAELSNAIDAAIRNINRPARSGSAPPTTPGLGPWLWAITQDEAIDAEIAGLRSASAADRAAAAKRLEARGDKAQKAALPLMKGATAEEDPEAREAMKNALKAVDVEAAQAARVPLDKADEVRLALLKQKEAVEAARFQLLTASMQGLEDDSADARREAAKALGTIAPDARPAFVVIRQKFNDEKVADVKEAIGEALHMIDPAAAAMADETPTPAVVAPGAAAIPPN